MKMWLFNSSEARWESQCSIKIHFVCLYNTSIFQKSLLCTLYISHLRISHSFSPQMRSHTSLYITMKCEFSIYKLTGGQAGPPKGPPCKKQLINFSIESTSILRTWFENVGSKTWFEQIFFILSASCLLKLLLLSKEVLR